MIKPGSPAGNRCLSAQSERFSSINACDLMPAVPNTTETLFFSIHHTLDASKPQLALLEKGLPSSLPGLHWNNSSSHYSLRSFFTVSQCFLGEHDYSAWWIPHCVPHKNASWSKNAVQPGPLRKATSPRHQGTMESSEQSASDCEHRRTSFSFSSLRRRFFRGERR